MGASCECAALDTNLANVGIDQSNLPIFNQDWWTKIARGSSHYRELRVLDGDLIVGRLPYILSRYQIDLQAHDPHWSHLGGPVVDERLSRNEQSEVLHLLVEQLPRWASAHFVCNPKASYADLVRTAFTSRGFEYKTQITYIRHPTDGDVMGTRKSKHNGHIKRAGRKLDCAEITAMEFVRFYEMNLRARQKKSYAPLDVVARLIEEAVTRGQACVIAAKPNHTQNGHNGSSALYDAAIVYVWDRARCYYWMSTHRSPSADSHPIPHPDATKLLAMKAMEHAQAMELTFDADGVTTPGSQHLYCNIFGLRHEEGRDVFLRAAALERFRQKCEPLIKAFTAKGSTLDGSRFVSCSAVTSCV